MKNHVCLLALAAATTCAAHAAQDRFFYAARHCTNEKAADETVALVRRAAAAGYNGLVLASKFDGLDTWSPQEMANFKKVEAACRETGVELIPLLWSVGYGTMLWRNPNLAEGLPLVDVEYTVSGRELVPSSTNGVASLDGFKILDRATVEKTAAGFAFSGFARDKYHHARILRHATVKPYTRYVLTGRARSLGMGEGRSTFLVQGYVGGRHLFFHKPLGRAADGEWVDFSYPVVTGAETAYDLYAGVWGRPDTADGRAEIASLDMRECGTGRILRRGGCPLSLRRADDGRALAEGTDFAFARDKSGDSRFTALDGGALKAGDKVLVSGYTIFPVKSGTQIPVCMCEEELYDYFARNAQAIEKAFSPRRWFLSMDEIRLGGTCQACRSRDTDMAHILGDCVRRQREIIRRVHPDAQIYIWGDMFNPWVNAREHYMLTRGSFKDSLSLLPKDMIIADWNGATWDRALDLYKKEGFQVLGCTYYDGKDLNGRARHDVDAAAGKDNVRGYMYTTWQSKYDLLEDFAKMIP